MKELTLDQALTRVEKLEKKNIELKEEIKKLKEDKNKLKEELEYYKARKASGRQPHNTKWTNNYNDVVDLYEAGYSIDDIAKEKNLSARTIYRYKAYYDKINENLKKMQNSSGKMKEKTREED